MSNNLVMVTAFKASADDENVTYMIEKSSEALRTSYSLQLSSTLNFKSHSLTLG